MPRPRLVLLIVGGTLLIGVAIAAQPLTLRVEQPSYRVRRADGPIEIRDYAPMIVAQVDATGARGAAINGGFRALAGYIFGANHGAKKIDMTAPVMQQRAGGDGVQTWTIRFAMPRRWDMATLPAPSAPGVSLHRDPARLYAVIRFAGLAGEGAVNARTRALTAYLVHNGLAPVGTPILAFYNPPWTLPFLRRNEVMIALDPAGQTGIEGSARPPTGP